MTETDAVLGNEYVVNFPANYRLRTQILKSDDKAAKRQDPFLYGHPLGPKERFRSPAEFALHLVWLLSNSESHEDCSCQLCRKMVKDVRKPLGPPAAKTPIQQPLGPSLAPAAAVGAVPGAPGSRTNTATPAYISPPHGGGSDVFRCGELVWFKKDPAWRLGIVRVVGEAHDPDHRRRPHRIAPLGHVCLNQQDVTKEAIDMRPFLGFSIPKPNPQLEGKSYDQVSWQQLAANSPNPEVVGLEASKLAAAAINGAFSLFNRKQSISATQHMFGGVFLGAEQIFIGDALRVRPAEGPDTPQDIMSIRSIYSDGDGVKVLGNTYRPAPGAAPPGAEPPPPGQVFAEEMAMYAAVTGQPWHWQQQEKDAVRAEMEVYGRYYATDRLMPLLKPDEYQAERARGGAPVDGTAHLNRRFQTGNAGYVGHKATRAATIGAAVAVPVVLGNGIVEEAGAV